MGFLGQFLVPLVKIFTRKKILFDAFLSIYQTLVFDRGTICRDGLLARFARSLDRSSCRLADKVFLDTDQHIHFFVTEFQLENKKFTKLIVGSDDTVMFPRESPIDKDFIVHFHGEFQALHGTEYIIEAARLLPFIKFQMIGAGERLRVCLEKIKTYKLNNVIFIPTVPYEKLCDYMSYASICLGIFGNTPKTQMVIPHKAYEALAMKKVLITSDTPAAREILTHRVNAILCQAADAEELAKAIMLLKEDPNLRDRIAENGYDLFQRECSPRVLGQVIYKSIREIINSSGC